ncbi:WD domain, G-beta repeat-containing protein, putative [Eimeria praecox]|uniref:WD domain, G-beta repeat-containing protein, putative n=1 Tax=Eimeria praecox TaxID=51316 RepID=U6GA21_9EIME|nr:WD domain, G-beta repeat-containing protein, putative [Eimeria praecox]
MFLLRALANSLSSEQQLNASAALQNKRASPVSPCLLDDLRRTLIGPDHLQGRIAVQAALEEQLALYCGWPQRLAIHRLLFLEPPWALSPEERYLLETLYAQPTVWWSPAQEDRFFTSLADSRAGALNSSGEVVQLLLQLLAASLTPQQRLHLETLLGVPHMQATIQQIPTILSRKQDVAPTSAQVRAMALLQRTLEGEVLTPVENGLLQEGILRELSQLLPPEELQALYSLLLSRAPVLVPGSSVLVLEDLRRARELWESRRGIAACMEQVGKGFRQMFVHFLAFSLTAEQLEVLNQLLRRSSGEPESDREPQRSHGLAACIQSAACYTNTPLHGDDAGYREAEDSKAGPRAAKQASISIKEAVEGHEGLKTECVTAMTREQAAFLELLVELHHFGCQTSQQDNMLVNLPNRYKFLGPAFDQQLRLAGQLFLFHFSKSLSEKQVEFIRRITCVAQYAPQRRKAHSDEQTSYSTSLTTGGETVREACQFASEPIMPSQRWLLHWLLSQKLNQAAPRELMPPLMNEDSPAELRIVVPQQPLLQLASSLSEAQVEMLLFFLNGLSEEPTGSDSKSVARNASNTVVQGTSGEDGRSGPQQISTSESFEQQTQHLVTSCSSIPAEELRLTKSADDTTKAHNCKRDSIEALPTLPGSSGCEDFAGCVPCQSAELQTHQGGYQGTGFASPHAASPEFKGTGDGHTTASAHLDEAPHGDVTLSGVSYRKGELKGEHHTNGKVVGGFPGYHSYHEKRPSRRTWCAAHLHGSGCELCISILCCITVAASAENLAHNRSMVQQLILEAADHRIFLEDLKMWRQQYNQRAKLREALNPYILKVQTLQQGYLKRCPCLYHQQQDQREEEQRKANLKILGSLGSSIWGPGDQTPTPLGSFSIQGPALSSGELQQESSREEVGDLNHGDTAPAGVLSLATAFRQTANTPVGRTFSKDIYSSTRQQSRASSSECCSPEPVSRSSAGSGHRPSSLSPVSKAPSHCSSLGSAPFWGSSEGQTPVSSPTRLRSPMGSRAERHQRGSSREESVPRGERDIEVSVEERKKRMQQQALEKAQRVKEDARVAFLVVLMKQMQPGNPALGIELVDRINLSHLNSKTLPKGKGWKTQGLLRMIEGIATLVCKLPRGAEVAVASSLQPLLALASKTRAEDIDLAIHAEFEGIRRALLRPPVCGSTGPEKGQMGDGQGIGMQIEGKDKVKDAFTGSAVVGTEEDDTKLTNTEGTAPATTVTQEAPRLDLKKIRPKAEGAEEVAGRVEGVEALGPVDQPQAYTVL